MRTVIWQLVKAWIRVRFPDVQRISTQSLAQWIDNDTADLPVLLDVRSPQEYQVSHLPYAQLAPAQASDLTASVSPDAPIVAYCSVGYRSARFAQQLQQLGYHRVFNLEGSIFQWVNEGRSVYRDDHPVEQVHPYNARWGQLLKPSYRGS